MIANQCPICLEEKKLVKHHWYEKDDVLTRHNKLICSQCNLILRAAVSNHILPDWETQINYVKLQLIKHPRIKVRHLRKHGKYSIVIDKELFIKIKQVINDDDRLLIPMKTIFDNLGYEKINGIFYGILLGAVSMVAIELGFEVVKLGTIWVIKKPESKDTNHQKDGSDK